jgi:glutathione synthase
MQLVGAGPPAPEAAVMHAPLAVLPAPFPAASFRKACGAALAFNSLIAAVAADSEYLQRTLAPAAEYDDFTVRARRIADGADRHHC